MNVPNLLQGLGLLVEIAGAVLLARATDKAVAATRGYAVASHVTRGSLAGRILQPPAKDARLSQWGWRFFAAGVTLQFLGIALATFGP